MYPPRVCKKVLWLSSLLNVSSLRKNGLMKNNSGLSMALYIKGPPNADIQHTKKRPRRAVYRIFKPLSFSWLYRPDPTGRNRTTRLPQESAPPQSSLSKSEDETQHKRTNGSKHQQMNESNYKISYRIANGSQIGNGYQCLNRFFPRKQDLL